MNGETKNDKQDIDQSNDNKKDLSSQKNNESLFSFLPKEIVEEIEVSDSSKNIITPNSTKVLSNFSDIPEFSTIPQKSGEIQHQSPDQKMKYRNLAQKQQKKNVTGVYSNNDNNININNLMSVQNKCNSDKQNQMYEMNNYSQWRLRNALMQRRLSGNANDSNDNMNIISLSHNNLNQLYQNSNNYPNMQNNYNYNNNQMNMNMVNSVNNMQNINKLNNQYHNFNSMNNLNPNFKKIKTNLDSLNSINSTICSMNNMSNNLSNAMNISNNNFNNLSDIRNHQYMNNRMNINTMNNIQQMFKMTNNELQKKNRINSSNNVTTYLDNPQNQRQFYVEQNKPSNFQSMGPKNNNSIPLNKLYNNFNQNQTQKFHEIQEIKDIKNIPQNKQIEITDAQIDYLFSQLYNLPNGVALLLYLIEQISVPYFIKLIKTIKGSKYLQNILLTNPPKESEIDYITKIICNNYREIMCDYYGNYFLQKFFHFCSLKNRLDIYNAIQKDYIEIANDICGNHSLQCLISLQSSNEEKKIIQECVQGDLKNLSFGCNSSHVISKIIECLNESDRQFINTFIVNNLMELCLDPNGICIVKEFILNIKSNFYVKLIISCFENETEKLTLNQFGNFVIQETIKVFGYNYCKRIISKLLSNIVLFSVSKFSSNVIDFLLEYLSKNEFTKFCKALKKIFLNEDNFKEMIKNKFSIYVIENSLELLIKIDENYFDSAAKKLYPNQILSKNNESDSSDSSASEDLLIYEKFCKLKKQIFQFIENNSAAKEKKKILVLIKVNKSKNI